MRAHALLIVTLMACADLPTVERLRCGNGLHEPEANEDCDGLAAESPFACGPVGTPAACRLTCVEARCPAGWGCGNDGICRAPGGGFEPAEVLSLAGVALRLGDLDGDGQLDLITQGAGVVGLAFGSERGFVDVHRVPISRTVRNPGVGDVNGDGLDDISALVSGHVRVLLGDRERELAPLAVPLEPRVPGPAIATAALHTTAPFLQQRFLRLDAPARLSVLGHRLDSTAVDALFEAAAPGRFMAGDLDPGPSESEFVYSWAGATTVPVLRMVCADAGECVIDVVQTLELPPAHAATALGAFFGDVDHDGNTDLVVSARGAEGNVLLVAYQSGGVLGALRAAPELAPAACADCGEDFDRGGLRAIADVTGDGRSEFITATGIFTHRDGLVRVYRTEGVWSQVAIADIDGDGTQDVLGRIADEISFVRALGDGRFVTGFALIPPAYDMTVGDFDGDGRTDVAYATDTDRIEFLFSRPDGAPESGLGAADFDQPILRLDRLIQHDFASGDFADDLVLTLEGGDYLFRGDPIIPYTPLVLRDPAAQLTSISLGRFAAEDHGILSTTARPIDGVQVFYNPHGELPAAPTGHPWSGCGPLEGGDVFTQSVDWDGDGQLELLMLAVPTRDEGQGPRREAEWDLRHVQIEGAAAKCRWSSVFTERAAPVEVIVGDFDGDGGRDVVALLAPQAEGQSGAGASRLRVWSGVDTPQTSGPSADASEFELSQAATAGAALRLRSHADSVVIFDPEGARVLDLEDGTLDGRKLAGLPGGVIRAAAADVNGDGLQDLVAKTPTSVFLLRQTACTARDEAEGHCTREVAP